MPAFFCHLLFIWPTIDGLDRKQQPGSTRHKAALPLSCLGLIQIRKLPLDPDAFLLTDVDQQSQDGAQQDMLQSGTEHDRFPSDPFDGQEVGGHAFIDTTLAVDQDDLVHVLWLVLFEIRAFTHPFGILHDRIRSGSVADLDLDPLLQHRTQMAEMGRQDRFFVLREHQSHCFVCVSGVPWNNTRSWSIPWPHSIDPLGCHSRTQVPWLAVAPTFLWVVSCLWMTRVHCSPWSCRHGPSGWEKGIAWGVLCERQIRQWHFYAVYAYRCKRLEDKKGWIREMWYGLLSDRTLRLILVGWLVL